MQPVPDSSEHNNGVHPLDGSEAKARVSLERAVLMMRSAEQHMDGNL